MPIKCVSFYEFKVTCFLYINFLTKNYKHNPVVHQEKKEDESLPQWVIQDVSQHQISDSLSQGRATAQFDFEVQRCSSHCFGCVVQADPEEIPTTAVSGSGTTVSQTTTFADEVEGVTVGESAPANQYEIEDSVTTAGLADFLQRPVRIASFTWAESDATGTTTSFSPWKLFFNNTQIKYKLNNYAFLRCNLKVKIIVNASPFYFGAMRACYQPLPAFKSNTIVNDASGSLAHLIPYSQQPGLWIYPAHSEGGEMILPFFYPKNFLRVGVAQDFTDMGTLRMITYTPLDSANGATGQGVSVQIYAWAEDVVLAGPTLGLALQARDEYGTGPVSGPASTVARIAGMVKGVPIIGKFATATEMGANAISGIAKLFGFTNVPVIDPTAPYRPGAFPQLASSEIGFPIEKLTIDAKNELTIDPTSVGLPPHDELATEYLVKKDSLIARCSWSTTSAVDTPLFTSRVTPFMFFNNNATTQQLYFTPMGMVSNLFNNWRGDMVFTFKVVASPYHKGRIRISYDPYSSTVQTTGDVGSALFNTILDIGSETEIEVRVPYQQALAWMRVNTSFATSNIPFSTSTSPTLTNTDVYDNGMISMKVLTLLTAPVATSAVSILVFVRGEDNMEFANPVDPGQTFTPFQVQAQPESDDGIQRVSTGETSDVVLLDRNRVNFGECVKSLRPLLRRSNFSETYQNSTVSTNAIGMTQWTMTRWNPYFGYDPNGMSSAKGTIVPASNFNFNYVKNMPYNWVANCYIGQRGAGHLHFNVSGQGPSGSILVARKNSAESSTTASLATSAAGTVSANARIWASSRSSTVGGGALTSQWTQAGLSVSVPNYTAYKFESTEPGNCTKPPLAGTTAYDGSSSELITLQVDWDGSTAAGPDHLRISKFISVGTDFNLFYFLNVPTWYRLTSFPTAN